LQKYVAGKSKVGLFDFSKIPYKVLPLPLIDAYSAPALYNEDFINSNTGKELKIAISKSFRINSFQLSMGIEMILFKLVTEESGFSFENAQAVFI